MAQERILIVDGDLALLQMLQARLEARGYLVDSARSGTQALNILKNTWVDMIVLAVVLRGGMHGFRLFKKVKRKKEFSKIPIIMQSSKSYMKRMFENMGAEAFFTKPYSVSLFLEKIADILERRELL